MMAILSRLFNRSRNRGYGSPLGSDALQNLISSATSPHNYDARTVFRIANGFMVVQRVNNPKGEDNHTIHYCETPDALAQHLIAVFTVDALKGK